MQLDITCSTDDNYVQHCMAMLCSVFENNRTHSIKVHLLHHGLSLEKQKMMEQLAGRYNNQIIYYDVDIDKLSCVSIADNHPNLSIATYFRFFLPSLLEEDIKRVLYLDCDVIVLKDISELFNLDMEEYGVAAVKDATPGTNAHRMVMGLDLGGSAFCAGVLMINIDYWRKYDCQMHMLDFASKMGGHLFMEDQDVLNHEFRGHWFQLPYKYGYAPMSIASLDKSQKMADIIEYVCEPSIIHYATHVKPWLDIRIPDDEYYWKYVKLSGYPNPVETRCLDRYRNPIRVTKVRYYLNLYIHPFIPDTIEILLRDIFDLLVLFTSVFNKRKFREYRIKRWLRKYTHQ